MTKKFVGHPMPPIEYRFKKGQSGNPNGRPKGAKNTYKILDDILSKRVQLVQDGRNIKLDRRTIILFQAVQSAMKGNNKAIQTLLPHFVNMDVLERCNAPEIVNPDMIQISLYKSKFEQIADEHFSKIGAVKVRTPTLGRYKGTSNIDPYETQNKKGKTLYLKFTHDLLLRSVLADLMVPVYEIGNVFRNMGISYKYATEYTMLESHIPCQDLQYGIHFAQTILQDFAHSIGKNDFDNLPVKTLQQSFSEFGKDLTSMSDSEQVDFYKDKIKPSGTFVSVYQPAIASPLAKIDPETNLGLDAEVVYNGKGIAHIYVCENNYDKLVKIFRNQDKTQQRWDKDFLLKAKAGIPSTVGVAIGLDRTIAGLCGVTVNDLVMRGKLSNER